ncbi:hypothetical protein ACFQ6Q_10625 [Streptomyces sp. NPDC056437]|uniref:hypothetical protein n=1 Tax=Streptomyces sp. NPDC056437 TaxID=3345816 RepID=UPI0036BE1E58
MPFAVRRLRAAAKRGRPLSDRETLRLVGFENGERLLNALDRLELAGDLLARDEVIRSGLHRSVVRIGPYAAMNRLLGQKRYREAVLLHYDFERLASGVSLPKSRPDPFKAVGTQGTPEQIMEVLALLRDRDQRQDVQAVMTAVARKRHQQISQFRAVPWGLLALPGAIALNQLSRFVSNGLLASLWATVSGALAIVFYISVGLLLYRMNTRGKQDVVDVCLALRDEGHQDAVEAILVAARDETYLIYRRWVTAFRLRQAGLPEAAEYVMRHRAHLDVT